MSTPTSNPTPKNIPENSYWDKKTIEEGADFVQKNIYRGIRCPCCNQTCRLYYRSITSAMAYALILIYKKGTDDYFHIEDYLKEQQCSSGIRGDFPKLRFWGFIEPSPKGKADGNKRSGFYRITDSGKRFVKGELTVPSHVKIYNNSFYGYHDESYTGIQKALKNKFNYNELMNYEERNKVAPGQDKGDGDEDFDPRRAAC